MSMLQQFRLYADYNRLMNRRIFDAAGRLSKAQLTSDRGAFFKSLLGTLNHILVGDIIWLQRFLAHPPSVAVLAYVDGLARPTRLDAILFDDAAGRCENPLDKTVCASSHIAILGQPYDALCGASDRHR